MPSETVDASAFSYIGLEELIQNKQASGRSKDLEDLPFLVEALKQTRNND